MAKKFIIKMDKLALTLLIISIAIFTVYSVWEIAVDKEWRYLYYPIMWVVGVVFLWIIFYRHRPNKKKKVITEDVKQWQK